ncbi:unnamed protein product [Rhodiola kirilowii]
MLLEKRSTVCCYIVFLSNPCPPSDLPRWPSRRITPLTTSLTRLTGTASKNLETTATPPPKEWILNS